MKRESLPGIVFVGTALLVRRGAGAAETPTFTRDVAPIVFAQCAPCHHPGDVAPFSLLTYRDTRKRAAQIADITAKRVMPPWKPHPGHGDFLDERRLSNAQIAVFRRWVQAGMPEGDARALPPAPQFPKGWRLGKPDLVLKMAAPFTIPAEGQDVYQHFVFSLGPKKERYLRAIEVRPSNRRVAHHAVGIIDISGKARELDAKDPAQGYGNMGGSGFVPAGFTAGYVPGQRPRMSAEDDALILPAGGDFVLQMHYHPTGQVETDQTEVGFYFTDRKPKRSLGIALLGSSDIDIRPGDSAYTVRDSFTLPTDLTVYSIWAHMHFIGKDVRVWAELPDGTTRRLLWIDDWDFNWQDTYRYAGPIRLPAKTTIRSTFIFDNSAQNPRNPSTLPKRVLLGENSQDEMAGLVIGGNVDNPLAGFALLAADIGHYFEMEGKSSRARAEAQKVKAAEKRRTKR